MAPPTAGAPPTSAGAADLPIEGKTVKAVTLLSLKRTHDLFVGNHGQKIPLDEEAQRLKLACKVWLWSRAQNSAAKGWGDHILRGSRVTSMLLQALFAAGMLGY
jgi:hypothetical protein